MPGSEATAFISASDLRMIKSLRSQYNEIAAFKDVETGIKFCRKFGILPDQDLKGCVHCNNRCSVVISALPSKANYPCYVWQGQHSRRIKVTSCKTVRTNKAFIL